MNSKIDAIHHSAVGDGRSQSMIRTSSSISSMLQLLIDIAIVEGILFLLAYLKSVEDYTLYHYPATIAPILMWFIYSNSGLYRMFSNRISCALNVLLAWMKVITILVILAFISKNSADFSRAVIILWFVIGALAQVVMHMCVDYFICSYLSKHRETIASILVGNSYLGSYLARHINNNAWMEHKIVGVICDKQTDEVWHVKGLPRLGGLNELRSLVEKYQIRRVYFALPMSDCYQIRDLELELIDLNVDLVWAPDIFGLHMISPSVKEVAGLPLYYLSQSPIVEGARLSKLLLDKVLAMIALVLFGPIMIIAAIAVKLNSPGPVLFRQERHGFDGKTFLVLKFRSMKMHQEQEGQLTQATAHDTRVTTIGAFLRKTSIDELPQLFNVLKGEMSLVGPRPHANAHNRFYADKIEAYMSRHRILPGMTGMAQVNGCRGETDCLEKMQKRVDYDLVYINNWSIWLDIRIMIQTVYTVLKGNAY